MSAQVAADLRAAADVLERDGWQQGHFGNQEHGFCAVGALESVFTIHELLGDYDDGIERDAYKAIASVIGSDDIVHWNDEDGRTADEVIAALRAAADAAEAAS